MMKRIMLGGLALLFVFAMPVMAGKNGGGAMLVHTDDTIVYTSFDTDYCDNYDAVDPGDDCAAVVTQSNIDGNVDGAVVFLLAAFVPEATPGVSVAYFGIDHNFEPGWIVGTGFCGPDGTLEIPDSGWPDSPATAGNSVAMGLPVTGDNMFPFYWLAAYGLAGNYIGTAVNPTGGYAGFVSDDNPGFLDEIDRFGSVHWFEAGTKDCPVPPIQGACCLPDATCEILFEADCTSSIYLGTYQGDGTTCDVACGACCYWQETVDHFFNRRCVVTTADDCLDEERWNAVQLDVLLGEPAELVLVGADWSYAGAVCTGDPDQADVEWYCQDPRESPFPTEETSWGKLKSLYR